MTLLSLQKKSFLEDVFDKGVYADAHGKIAYHFRRLESISLCKVMFLHNKKNDILLHLRNALGLRYPDKNFIFTAGTRSIFRFDDESCYLQTEGESEGGLLKRLSSVFANLAGVFDISAAYAVIRIDGYFFNKILAFGLNDIVILESMQIGQVLQLDFKGIKLFAFYASEDRWILYLPRSKAVDFYQWIARMAFAKGIEIH